MRHIYINILYTEIFFFNVNILRCCLLNSKLLLFDFIHQMLLELLLNVKNCVRCWRGWHLTFPAVMEVTLADKVAAWVHTMARALANPYHRETWAWWWWGLRFVWEGGSKPRPLQPPPDFPSPRGKEWAPASLFFRASQRVLYGPQGWELLTRTGEDTSGGGTWKWGAAAVWRWFILTASDSSAGWRFLSSDRMAEAALRSGSQVCWPTEKQGRLQAWPPRTF